jgi:hypothetical protein
VQLVADIIKETASASQEQSSGVEQVNQAIGHMDEITQQNAALVEQASAAAESLTDQAAKLAQLVDTFKLTAGPKASRARRAPIPTTQGRSAARSLPAKSTGGQRSAALPAKKLAAGGRGDEWEEF